MEKTNDDLQKSIESKDWDTALDILDGLQRTGRTEIVHIDCLMKIMKNRDANAQIKFAAAKILINRSTRELKALEGVEECLDCYHYADASLCILAVMVQELTLGKELVKELVKSLPPKIFSNLLQARSKDIKEHTLTVLSKIAKEDPDYIPMTILLEAMLTENEEDIRERILEIAEIVNPVDKPKEILLLDTLFLMNWIRKERDIRKNQTRDLIDNLNEEIKGPEPFLLAHALISLSRAVDLLFFLVPKRYRGHDVHSLNVATLGLFLLDIHISENETLKEYIQRKKDWTEEQVVKAWLIAALLHDHALPISFMLQIAPCIYIIKKTRSSYSEPLNKLIEALTSTYGDLCSQKLREIYGVLLEGDCSEGLSRLKKLISTELQRINCDTKVETSDILDHGILSAINLTMKLGVFNKNWGVDIEVIKSSAKAIAVHNLSQKVDLEKDPISFLLVLCDDIQEWGREMVLFPEIIVEISSIQIGRFKCGKGKKMFFPDVLEISFVSPPPETSEKTGFNETLFKDKKIRLKRRLVFDPTINPHRISYEFRSKA